MKPIKTNITGVLVDDMYQKDDFVQLVTTKELNEIALRTNMKITYKGTVRPLGYKKIAPGVYRLFKILP